MSLTSTRSSGDMLSRFRGRHRYRAASTQAEATPAAEPSPDHLGLPQGERTFTMFVQTARAGTWAAKDGDEGTYTLTLTGLPAQTVYFSDRPSRVVGMQSTAEFVQALGFVPENPPNAALVTTGEDGQDDILIIELFNPVYTAGDGASGSTLVYDARILQNYRETNLGGVVLQADDAEVPAAFSGASLFIDDCSDGEITCVKNGKEFGKFPYGCCYKFPACFQCHDVTGICRQLAGCENGECQEKAWQSCWLW